MEAIALKHGVDPTNIPDAQLLVRVRDLTHQVMWGFHRRAQQTYLPQEGALDGDAASLLLDGVDIDEISADTQPTPATSHVSVGSMGNQNSGPADGNEAISEIQRLRAMLQSATAQLQQRDEAIGQLTDANSRLRLAGRRQNPLYEARPTNLQLALQQAGGAQDQGAPPMLVSDLPFLGAICDARCTIRTFASEIDLIKAVPNMVDHSKLHSFRMLTLDHGNYSSLPCSHTEVLAAYVQSASYASKQANEVRCECNSHIHASPQTVLQDPTVEALRSVNDADMSSGQQGLLNMAVTSSGGVNINIDASMIDGSDTGLSVYGPHPAGMDSQANAVTAGALEALLRGNLPEVAGNAVRDGQTHDQPHRPCTCHATTAPMQNNCNQTASLMQHECSLPRSESSDIITEICKDYPSCTVSVHTVADLHAQGIGGLRSTDIAFVHYLCRHVAQSVTLLENMLETGCKWTGRLPDTQASAKTELVSRMTQMLLLNAQTWSYPRPHSGTCIEATHPVMNDVSPLEAGASHTPPYNTHVPYRHKQAGTQHFESTHDNRSHNVGMPLCFSQPNSYMYDFGGELQLQFHSAIPRRVCVSPRLNGGAVRTQPHPLCAVQNGGLPPHDVHRAQYYTSAVHGLILGCLVAILSIRRLWRQRQRRYLSAKWIHKKLAMHRELHACDLCTTHQDIIRHKPPRRVSVSNGHHLE